MTKIIAVGDLHPHPGNPRLAPHQDVVDQIAAQLNGAMDEAHALIVRPNGTGYQIVSGHHRRLAAIKAGLTELPCHVREMDDEEAYMALALNNAQRELSALERGFHALNSGMDVKAYAEMVGRARRTVHDEVMAARVADAVAHMRHDLSDRTRHLAEIHAAAEWAWPALALEMLDKNWSVEQVRSHVKAFPKVKGSGTPIPAWIHLGQIATSMLRGGRDPIPGIIAAYDKAVAAITANELEAKETLARLEAGLSAVASVSAFLAIANPILAEQEAKIRAKRQDEEKAARTNEEKEARRIKRHSFCSLDEWNGLSEEERKATLKFTTSRPAPTFNAQENEDIGWAKHSWNPITGCQHFCSYCYARDIAHQKRMEKVYPFGFAPTLRPLQLLAPSATKVPAAAATDATYRNVFLGSMTDLWGRWVPEAWIEAVLSQVRAAPQWTFLCLTKFPKRMAEFEIPPNVWMGTTVDLQVRVPAAEAGFAKLKCAVRWLSIEPMLEPLTFKRLDLFDWMVVGGASKSSKTPEWHPPAQWIYDLRCQAEAAGVMWYEKSNLWSSTTARTLQLPNGLPVAPDPGSEPDPVFRYLGAKAAP